MEYLDGETLAQRSERMPALTVDERLDVLRQTCSGVEAIHAQGIVHRDLKPSNIFLTQSASGPRVAVTDFGIAHADPRSGLDEDALRTWTGAVVGTPRYMAPEQLRGEQVTARADIFALGVVAADLFDGVGTPRRALDHALRRARADDPSLRPRTPGEFLSSVERALRTPWWARRRLLAGAIATFIVAVVGWTALRPDRPAGMPPGDRALSTVKGQRLYREGIQRLGVLDDVGARDLLEGAVAAEPSSPTARGALARAWWNLGYSSKAKVLAREALEAIESGPSSQRTRIEGLYRKMSGDLPKAEELFQAAYTSSRSPEDALDLASVQPAEKAFVMLSAFRKDSHTADPRIDLAFSDAASRSGHFQEARESASAVEATAREQRMPFVLAAALRAEAHVIKETDEPIDHVFGKLDEAAAILKEAGNLGAVADIECEKAEVLAAFGTTPQIDEARRHLENAVSLFRRLGNPERAYWWLASIGAEMLFRGKLADARTLMREAKDEIESTGEAPDPSFWVVDAWLSMYTVDLPTARRELARFRSSTVALEVMPRPSGIQLEAEILREEDRLTEAQSLLETWLAKGESTGVRMLLSDVPVRLARLDGDLGHPDRCLERLQAHERAGHDVGPLFIRFRGPAQARCLLQKGDVPAARRVAEQGWAAATSSGAFTWRIFNGLALARADAAEGRFSEALSRIRSLLAEASAHGHLVASLESRLALGEVEAAAGASGASVTLKALEDDAREKGFLRLARLAHEARSQVALR
jgi:tetratricopeptide (TPR) repeat protein